MNGCQRIRKQEAMKSYCSSKDLHASIVSGRPMIEGYARRTVADSSQWAATNAVELSLFQVGEQTGGLVKFR